MHISAKRSISVVAATTMLLAVFGMLGQITAEATASGTYDSHLGSTTATEKFPQYGESVAPAVAGTAKKADQTAVAAQQKSSAASKAAKVSDGSGAAYTIKPSPKAGSQSAPRKVAKREVGAASASTSSGSEQAQAQAILDGYKAKYSELAGATVSFGDARGYQAITYYQSGRIVISTSHTASLQTIIRHEIGHIIDWEDNGVIDWGENIPAL